MAFLTFESCSECNCPEPSGSLISQYELDKTIVQINTVNVATGFETVFSKTITDSTQRAHFSQAFVDSALFYNDKSGYFFIETLNDAWVIAHISHDLIGTSRINIQDETGKYFIREMVEKVRYSGSGFVGYYKKNYATNVTERKLSFVTSIPAAQWFIGTGVYGNPGSDYYDAVEAQKIILKEVTLTLAHGFAGIFDKIYTTENDRILFCRDFIDHIHFFDNGSGYFFISDFNGINIAHGADTTNQGQNHYDLQDIHGAYFIRDMIDIAKNSGSGYYKYYWINPVTEKEGEKIVFVNRIPNTDYFIASGFYMD